MRTLLFDTETTGLTPKDNAVCEVAWRLLDEDMNTVDQDTSLIDPLMPIPSGASAVNGITDNMVRGAPTIHEYMSGQGAIFDSDDIVITAHNLQFDFGFLREFIHPAAKKFCTLRASRMIFPNADSHKQAALAYSLGLPIDRATTHSAEGDLSVLHMLLLRLVQEASMPFPDLISLVMAPKAVESMPFGKHKGKKLEHLPPNYASWLLTEANIDDDLRSSLMSIFSAQT